MKREICLRGNILFFSKIDSFYISPDFNQVTKTCLSTSFGLLLKYFDSIYSPNDLMLPPSVEQLAECQSLEIPLAKILPTMTRLTHVILNGVPNELVQVFFNNLSIALIFLLFHLVRFRT